MLEKEIRYLPKINNLMKDTSKTDSFLAWKYFQQKGHNFKKTCKILRKRQTGKSTHLQESTLTIASGWRKFLDSEAKTLVSFELNQKLSK